jgi:hypothetical protein
LPKFGKGFWGLLIFHILFGSSNILTCSNEMSAILDDGSFDDVTTGINNIKVFAADQILIGRCFKSSKSRQSTDLSAKLLVVV